MKKIKLFCLPYAGGSAACYHPWRQYINHSIELRPLELAGRGLRLGEPFHQSITEAVIDIYKFIQKDLDDGPYAIFGHSMGCMLAYELAYMIKNSGHPSPCQLFFSGKCPPGIKNSREPLYLLRDREFIEEVFKMGGTPKELLENRELLEIFLPILRADFKIVETYRHEAKDERLDSDLTVFWGKQEKGVTLGEIGMWRDYTHKNCQIHLFNGGHFFINEYAQDVVNIINSTLLS